MRFGITILFLLLSFSLSAKEPVESEARDDLAALHAAMAGYLKENGGIWPRFEKRGAIKPDEVSKFWFDTLKPYGALEKHWSHSENTSKSWMSYLPTDFARKKDEAHRLETQPWFVLTFKSSSGCWLVCRDGKPKKFESEAREDLAALHSAMAKYLEKNGQIWPELYPDDREPGEALAKVWIEFLKPYGAKKKHWTRSVNPSDSGVDYAPAMFDRKKGTAYRWEKQPWFVQVGNERTGDWFVCRDGIPRIYFPGIVPSGKPSAKNDRKKAETEKRSK